MSTEIAHREIQVIATPAEYDRALSEWQGRYNVLTPFTSMMGIAASHVIKAHVVKLDLDPAQQEVYSGFLESGAKGMPFLKGDRGKPNEELAIAKKGLRKLADLGSMSTWAVRLDNGSVRGYWSMQGYVKYKGLNGSDITRSASAEWDLRQGSERLKGWTPNQVTEGQKNGLRNCETRSINAAIREAGCGIKQKYTRAELEKPFLVVEVSFAPDMNDPMVKEIVTRHSLGSTALLYGQGGSHAPSQDYDDQPSEPRSVGRGSTAPAQPPAEEQPPTADAVKIKLAEPREFVYKQGAKTGQKGTKYVIVDSTGTEYSTFSKTHYDDAVRFKAANEWVEISTEVQGQYTNIIEIVRAGSQPTLPDLENT